MVARNLYLNQLISLMWDGQIKVITGIRRCGKSVLLFQLFYNYLLQSGVPDDHVLKMELDKRKTQNTEIQSPLLIQWMSGSAPGVESAICSLMKYNSAMKLKTPIIQVIKSLCTTCLMS